MDASAEKQNSKPDISIKDDPKAGTKRIWEIHQHLKCPLVGMCLSLEEHKRILKKTGNRIKGLSSHELHRSVMSHLDGQNRVSQKANRYLLHKYRIDLAELEDLCEEDFMEIWWRRLISGRVEGIFFAACVQNILSEESLAEIYGEIHMSGHANSAKLMQLRRHAELQKMANLKTAKLLNQEKQRTRSLRDEMRLLKISLNETRILLNRYKNAGAAETTQPKMEKLEEENRTLRVKLRKIKAEKKAKADQRQILEREKRRLQIELFDIKSTNQSMAGEVKALTAQIGSLVDCGVQSNHPCQKYQLCAKRILIVGGITKMKHLYRDLVKAGGGEFEYHDGYMKAGKKKLEAQVSRCDLVLCPVNCNSHGACDSVKAFCKKFNKPFKMLPGASLSTISSALIENSSQASTGC